jgi:predicted Zn finger-like uncharacterized protein
MSRTMPEVILNCPQCQRQLRVTEELLGRPVKCPACGLIFTVPMGGTEAQLAPVPVASEGPPAPRPEEGKRDPYEYPYDEHRRRLERGEPWDYERADPERARRLLLPPAICLTAAGVLGILGNLLRIVITLVMPQQPPGQDMPEIFRKAMEIMTPQVVVIESGVFALLSLVVLLAGIQMLRQRMFWLAVMGSFLAMINLECFCCVLGIPFGIWSLIILFRPEVQALFR